MKKEKKMKRFSYNIIETCEITSHSTKLNIVSGNLEVRPRSGLYV